MLGFAIFAFAYSLSMAWLFSGGLDYIVEYMKKLK
jgi:hypothetical protein